jgi:hypothetical protein
VFLPQRKWKSEFDTRECCVRLSRIACIYGAKSISGATMSWDTAEDYLYAKLEQSQFLDSERGREQGLAQFLDERSIRPGLEAYRRGR